MDVILCRIMLTQIKTFITNFIYPALYCFITCLQQFRSELKERADNS